MFLRRAFSLIELVIVVVLLAVLAGLAVASFAAVQGRAQSAAVQATADGVDRLARALAASDGVADVASYYAQAISETRTPARGRLLFNPNTRSVNVYSTSSCRSVTGSSTGGAGTRGSCSALPHAILSDQPVLYLRLGERSGTVAVDAAAGRHGTFGSGVSLNRAGMLTGDADTAAGFIGNSTGMVTVPADPAFNVTAFTLQMWIRTPAILGLSPGGYRNLFSKDPGAGASPRDFNFYVHSNDGTQITGLHLSSVPFASAIRDLPQPLAPSTVYQVGVVVDPAAGRTRYFLNGQVYATAPATVGTANAAYPLRIGSADNAWNGDIDEVALFNVPLSDARIAAHYAAGR